MSRVLKHIPNAITSLNVVCGFFSIIESLNGNFEYAFLFIIIAGILDFMDGFAARLLNAYSEIGKQLDSLADVISFGLAPAMMLYAFLAQHSDSIIIYAPVFIAIFSALRLAKFNVDENQKDNFIGLATPACALFAGSLITILTNYPNIQNVFTENIYIIPAISLLLSYLLVSNIPMFSFKIKSIKFKENLSRYILVFLALICTAATVILGLNWSVALFSTISIYILINIINSFNRLIR